MRTRTSTIDARHPGSVIRTRPARRLGLDTRWTVMIVIAGEGTFDRRTGRALTDALGDVAGSVRGKGFDPTTGNTRIEAVLVLDDAERHMLDAACAAVGRFRRAARQIGLPDWPVIEVRVTNPTGGV